MVSRANRPQTLPERTTTASNKATNTCSLSIVSIGMPKSKLSSTLSADSPDAAPPIRGQSTPDGHQANMGRQSRLHHRGLMPTICHPHLGMHGANHAEEAIE